MLAAGRSNRSPGFDLIATFPVDPREDGADATFNDSFDPASDRDAYAPGSPCRRTSRRTAPRPDARRR